MPKLPALQVGTPGIGQAEVLSRRAKKAIDEGRREEAILLFRRALEIEPTNTQTMNSLAIAYAERGELSMALEQFDNSVRIDPDQPRAWQNRGLALSRLGHVPEAISCFDRMIALQPTDVTGYALRADALYFLGRFQDAIAVYDRLIRAEPGSAPFAANRAATLQWCGRYDEALAEYDRAIALEPGHAWASACKAILLMTLGDLPNGLKLYESRWRVVPREHQRTLAQPLWLGDSDVAGKTLFIYWEQGFGDTLHCCRYVTMAARAGARVILEVQRPLTALMRTLDGVAELIEEGAEPPHHDFHCPIMSLPLAFGTTIDTIPAGVPYLHADSDTAEHWRRRLAGLQGHRIGLVWAGGSRIGAAEVTTADQRRSVSLAALAPLAAVPGCVFVSLQLGPPSEQAARPPGGMTLVDHTADLRSFADTAALMANLDLIISVDTAPAHLAGALGKPVWLLNRFDTDWRWRLDGETSLWYPTMRIFRQPKPGDWASVIQALAGALRDYAAGRP